MTLLYVILSFAAGIGVGTQIANLVHEARADRREAERDAARDREHGIGGAS